jgi:serine/threonine protein kinase
MTGDTGTKRYMAPEVHRKDPSYTVAVDIYRCIP